MSSRSQELTSRLARLRLTVVIVGVVVTVLLVWWAFYHDDLADLQPGQPAIGTDPAQAGNSLPRVDLTPTTTTSVAPTTTAPATPTTATPTTAAPSTTAQPPAGTFDKPELAAQVWYAQQIEVPAERVLVLQRDRRNRDTFRVVVSATRTHPDRGRQICTHLLRIVRVQGNSWRCAGYFGEAGQCAR